VIGDRIVPEYSAPKMLVLEDGAPPKVYADARYCAERDCGTRVRRTLRTDPVTGWPACERHHSDHGRLLSWYKSVYGDAAPLPSMNQLKMAYRLAFTERTGLRCAASYVR
jgi:hypothetical protein